MRIFGIFVLSIGLVCQAHATSVDVLSDADIQTYQQIFDLQESGQIKAAQKKESDLNDPILMGYVLYQRYFSKHYKTTQKEIQNWLSKYSDYPIATDVYALGKQKKIKNLNRPKGVFGGNTNACESVERYEASDLTRGLSISNTNERQLIRQFNKYLSRGSTKNAKNLLNDKGNQKILSKKLMLRARTALAFSYFLDGRDDLAWEQIKPLITQDNKNTPVLTYWLAGLVSWRQQKYDQAAEYFEKVSQRTADQSLFTAASFWAARSYIRLENYETAADYLREASQYPRYFYGLISMRIMGRNLDYVWEHPNTTDDMVTAEFSHPALKRFYALNQLGYNQWAIEELSKLYLEADEEGKGILWLISKENDFEEILQGMTGILDGQNMRYPVPNWIPQTKWQLDKALVYAFVRQESCFNHRAESSVGAMGLMQLMPKTAKELAKSLQCEYKTQNLKEPEYNLALGQEYIKKLLNHSLIQGNLIKLAVAYNAGPGNLSKWQKKMIYHDDPLLFIETIPSKETRRFTEKILMNYWVYQSLMDQPMDSLDQLILGRWPTYQMCVE